jgi:2-methylcitrate dehydratase PrpD
MRTLADQSKRKQVNLYSFTARIATCSFIYPNETQIPQAIDAKYLSMHLDRQLKDIYSINVST